MEFDESKPEPIVTPDTDNQTKFHPDEAPPRQREQYRRFEGYNSGIYNGEWADEQKRRRIDNLGVYDAISSQLELTNYQKREGRRRFDSINFRRLGYPVELIAFSVCVLVAREDGRNYDPYRADRNNDDLFVQIAENLRFKRKHVASCINRVREVVE